MSRELAEAVDRLTDRIEQLEKAAKTPARVAWRPREVARMTGLSYGQVLELIHAGQLGAVKDGRLHVVPDAELRRYLGRGITAA